MLPESPQRTERTNGAPLRAPEPPVEPGTMSILEHLEELRQRIIIAIIALIVGLVISAFLLTQRVMEWLVEPAGVQLINLTPPEVFTAYFKVALATGTALALPVILYEALMFVVPALTPREKRYVYLAVPGATLCFAVGVTFGYFFLLPAGLKFLREFSGGLIVPMWSVGPYLKFVSTLLFWIGVCFELPLVMFFLAKLHVVNTQKLSHFRRYAILLAFIIGAFVAPSPDPISQTMVAVPVYLLYELGLLLTRVA